LIFSVPAETVQADSSSPSGSAVLPRAGEEGNRHLNKLEETFAREIRTQPFGKKWSDIVLKVEVPKNQAGLGKAKTHPDLKFDPIELQEQSQYITDTRTEMRYGWLSLRLRRVFKYGRLIAVQIYIEPLGDPKSHKGGLQKDLAALKTAWKKPLSALGLSKEFDLRFNELKSPNVLNKWVVELEKKAGAQK